MRAEAGGGDVVRGALVIVLTGIVLGAGFNWIGLSQASGWGVPWVGHDRLADVPKVEAADPGDTAGSMGYGGISDPMAVGSGAAAAGVPDIPALGRPVQIQLAGLKQLIEAHAALLVDAREPDEFEQGHIPEAVNLPFDEVSSQPERLTALDSGGRPIVVYCGGGGCELSTSLAYDLVEAGHTRVAIFVGGFPEWESAGLPVARGAGR